MEAQGEFASQGPVGSCQREEAPGTATGRELWPQKLGRAEGGGRVARDQSFVRGEGLGEPRLPDAAVGRSPSCVP